jgi:hypothetical protein
MEHNSFILRQQAPRKDRGNLALMQYNKPGSHEASCTPEALMWLNSHTEDRIARGVEGQETS